MSLGAPVDARIRRRHCFSAARRSSARSRAREHRRIRTVDSNSNHPRGARDQYAAWPGGVASSPSATTRVRGPSSGSRAKLAISTSDPPTQPIDRPITSRKARNGRLGTSSPVALPSTTRGPRSRASRAPARAPLARSRSPSPNTSLGVTNKLLWPWQDVGLWRRIARA